jgi:hypothetical protein
MNHYTDQLRAFAIGRQLWGGLYARRSTPDSPAGVKPAPQLCGSIVVPPCGAALSEREEMLSSESPFPFRVFRAFRG